MKDLVAMYKKAEYSFLDSFDAEVVQRPSRMLRKVDIDELDFDEFCDELEEISCKKTKTKTMASKGSTKEHVQTTLMASTLIEALSADPVSIALKSGVRRKPASPMFKKPSKAEEEDKEGTEEEEEEEEREEDDAKGDEVKYEKEEEE